MPPVTSVTIVFDNNVIKVEIYIDSNRTNLETTITTSGSSYNITPQSTYYSKVYMSDGYIIDNVVSSYVTAIPTGDIIRNITNDTFDFVETQTGDTITIISKKATSQVSIDLTTLSGWGNVADGDHVIQVVAKADNYRDSEKSTAVSFTKGVTGHTLTITNSSSSADVLQVYASTSGSWGGDLLATIDKGSTSEVNIPTDYVYFACPTAEEVFFTLSNVNPSNALVMDSGGMDYIACKINQNGSCTITIG